MKPREKTRITILVENTASGKGGYACDIPTQSDRAPCHWL